jgi:hypothetical protein
VGKKKRARGEERAPDLLLSVDRLLQLEGLVVEVLLEHLIGEVDTARRTTGV